MDDGLPDGGLIKEDLFELFRLQLMKDFTQAGADGSFAETLPRDLDGIHRLLVSVLDPLSSRQPALFSSLLYRVDVSESQLKRYMEERPALGFIDAVAEVIVKRVLQKVILRKKFS